MALHQSRCHRHRRTLLPGDWSVTKTEASAATISFDPGVIARLLRLQTLTVEVRAGRAVRKHKLVKSGGPDDLVFQSVQSGAPMSDQNVLKRHLQPAARKLGLRFVNWQCLRTSHATWLMQAGADPKPAQGQMRHSRIFDHHGHLRADRAALPAAGFAEAVRVCSTGDERSGTRDRCPGVGFFRRRNSTFQFTFQNVPNQLSFG
jgi:hypothetical protein